jgi:hypothetical protein
MQLFLLFVVSLFTAPLILCAGPVILYAVPFVVIDQVYSFLNQSFRYDSTTGAH